MSKKKIKAKKKKDIEKEDAEFFEQMNKRETESDDPDNTLQEVKNQPDWISQEDEEGQLSVDVYEEDDAIVVKSTIAGVEPDDIDISLVNDMLTIRGKRRQEKKSKTKNYFFQECYWGSFSRSIILPVEVDEKQIDATIKNGILTIVLPKKEAHEKEAIHVKDEN